MVIFVLGRLAITALSNRVGPTSVHKLIKLSVVYERVLTVRLTKNIHPFFLIKLLIIIIVKHDICSPRSHLLLLRIASVLVRDPVFSRCHGFQVHAQISTPIPRFRAWRRQPKQTRTMAVEMLRSRPHLSLDEAGKAMIERPRPLEMKLKSTQLTPANIQNRCRLRGFPCRSRR
jgi:hypothetical protein